MPNFGTKSKRILTELHPYLQEILLQVIEEIDFSIICGCRSRNDQERAFREHVSKLHYPYSKHNTIPSLAVDIIPYPTRWDDEKEFHKLAKVVICIANGMGYPVIWGGDWDGDGDTTDQTFNDLAHLQLKEVPNDMA